MVQGSQYQDLMLSLKQKIIEKSHEIGIDKIGFASAAPFLDLLPKLIADKEAGYTTGFEHPVIEERVYPDRIFDNPQTIISICLAYPSQMKQPLPVDRAQRRGVFARASWGIDYHHILRKRMESLIEFMQEIMPEARFKAMVDTGALQDVAVAERAGLGFVGRNSLLITPEFGSYVYLGEILTDLAFPTDDPIPFGCGDCYRCIQSCPTQALLGDGRMNGQKCLSYQTQTKGYLDHEFRRKIGHVIYGCDICQLTCPYNQGKNFHLHPEMQEDPQVLQPDLKELIKMKNKDFKERYGHLAGAWRGRKPLQRNAIMALAHYRDQSAIPLLLELMVQDDRPVIRSSAAYAVSMIQRSFSQEIIDLMNEQLVREEEAESLAEFRQAIERIEFKKD